MKNEDDNEDDEWRRNMSNIATLITANSMVTIPHDDFTKSHQGDPFYQKNMITFIGSILMNTKHETVDFKISFYLK